MAFRDPRLQEADRQVRRLNSYLQKTAKSFGTNSIQYRELTAQLRLAYGKGSTALTEKNGVMQISRSKQALQSSMEDFRHRAVQRAIQSVDIERDRKRLLEAYKERTGTDPAKVDPSIKGSQRLKVRAQQINQAIKDQADYYATIDDRIDEALQALYDLETEMGEISQTHMDIKRMSRGNWTSLKTKMDMLSRLQSTLADTDFAITTEYETGLGGTILGVGGNGLT